MGVPIVLIVIGLVLIIVEIIIVPGFGIPGIIGGLAIMLGLYLAYAQDPNWGVGLTAATALVCIGLGYWAFKGNGLKRMTLENEVASKVNNQRTVGVEVGQSGTAISRLSPTGDAMFDEKIIEVQSVSGFIDVNCAIEIEKIENNTIFVTTKTIV
jgi:membrane-bound ClpP family serine protease